MRKPEGTNLNERAVKKDAGPGESIDLKIQQALVISLMK